jgi:PD-(D/E)XK nuclease superfamily
MKIDNFALTMFQACPAKFKLRILEGWTTRRKSAALGFGGAFHEGLATWYRTGDKAQSLMSINSSWPSNLPIDDWRTKEKCVQALLDYFRAYPTEQFRVVGSPLTLVSTSIARSVGQSRGRRSGESSLPVLAQS